MASWYEDLARSLDLQPADVATAFAGVRASVPVYAGLYAGETNAGHDEELLKRRGPLPPPALPAPTEDEQQRRMIEDFERQFPTPEIRAAAIKHMLAARSGKVYDPSTATRRVDFERQNASDYAGPEMRATPPTAKRGYQKGGGVKKTVQQMADELLLKGVKATDAPNLSRRSFFGLRAQPPADFPLAKVDDKALAKLEQQYGKEGRAPAFTERTTTASPGAGATRSTLKSIVETPMSRRAVMQAAAGQVMRHALPGVGDVVPGVGDLAQAAESIAPAAAVTFTDMIPAFIMRAMQQGMTKDEAIKATMEKFKLHQPHVMSDQFVMDPSHPVIDPMTGKPVPHAFQLDTLYDTLNDPMMAAADKEFIEPLRPSMALNNLLSPAQIGLDTPPLKMRGAMRQMREADPERYRQLIDQAKDYSTSTGETAIESGMMTPRNLEKFMRGVDKNPKYRPEHLWNDEYAGGGRVRKTLQQMAEEMFGKGIKTADKPDLARRSLFGLKAQPALDLPLARIDDIEKSLGKGMDKDLAKVPTVSEKSVEVNPATGSVKSALKSITETPMSRRAVLQTAAGQVLRHALPGVGDVVPTPDILGEITKIVDVAKPAQAAAASAFTNPIAIIMRMRKSGATEEEIGKALGLTNPAELGSAPKSSAIPKSQEEIDASKEFMFRNPEARAALEKASNGDIMKFAQLVQNKPDALPPDWLMERFLRNGELEERMRMWLNTKGQYAALEKDMPKDFAPPVDRDRATSEWQNFQNMYDDVDKPADYLRGTPPLLKTPSRALQEITGLGTDTDAPLMSVRGDLRQLRAADSEQYETMKNAARDVSMDSAETARAMGLPADRIEKLLKGEITTDDLPRWYANHRDFE